MLKINKEKPTYNISDDDKCYGKEAEWEWRVEFLFYTTLLRKTYFRKWSLNIELKDIGWEQHRDS